MSTESRAKPPAAERIASIDALRGLIMFLMIFVNDLGSVPGDVVPPWMKHFRGPDGMTFVDLVFPAFLFIVGMSIPFALASRVKRGDARWKIFLHILARTLSLLFIGIMMVNGRPDTDKLGWSGAWWEMLMFLSAIFAFCVFSPGGKAEESAGRAKIFRFASLLLRCAGFAALVFLAFAYRNKNDHPMITLSPSFIHHIWYGILGYIGWAYLVSAVVYLFFRTNRAALLGCLAVMMCLYPANKAAMFKEFWIAKHINIGVALGSRAAIAAAGLMLGAMLISTGAKAVRERVRFTLLLIAGCAAAAWLLGSLYGISKDEATPSWALWGCVATAALWLFFYFVSDVHPVGWISKPCALAGQNVLLAYLISEMLPSVLDVTGLANGYQSLAEPSLTCAIVRSVVCSLAILLAVVGLNRVGFRLKL